MQRERFFNDWSVMCDVCIAGWNMIRLDSGNQLCQAVGVTKTLTFLDLSYNALGNEGGRILGKSIMQNQTLKVKIEGNCL